uniref:Uncharacterized protein n=1 Tax=Arundo donax TaxID=35708 RepID=A0A0A9EI66_ARUDO
MLFLIVETGITSLENNCLSSKISLPKLHG